MDPGGALVGKDAPVDVGADVDAVDDVDAALVGDAWVDDTSIVDAGAAWEGVDVEVDPGPPESSDPPPQAARTVIAKIANAMRKKPV